MKSYGDSYYLNRVNEFAESDQHELAIVVRSNSLVPSRPQNAYVKSKVYMAVDSENPRMYQCSRVFALRGNFNLFS